MKPGMYYNATINAIYYLQKDNTLEYLILDSPNYKWGHSAFSRTNAAKDMVTSMEYIGNL